MTIAPPSGRMAAPKPMADPVRDLFSDSEPNRPGQTWSWEASLVASEKTVRVPPVDSDRPGRHDSGLHAIARNV